MTYKNSLSESTLQDPINNTKKSYQSNSWVEWLTFSLIVFCTIALLLITYFSAQITLWVSIPLLMLSIALHSSIQHEVLHGHPFNNAFLNESLIFIPFGLYVPYRRFRDTHLQHHYDPNLTDPYDDPESNYLDPLVWEKLSFPTRLLFTFNNTLAGRMVFGPAIGMYAFYRSDLMEIFKGNTQIALAYILHGLGLVPIVFWLITFGTIPFWAYFLAAYGGMSLLKIRTFLEHQAHEKVQGRTVIIESRGFFAFLFLNNNFHLVHHAHPQVAWYKLPELFNNRRDEFLRKNQGYVYTNYWVIFRKYFLSPKDGVPHPLWPISKHTENSTNRKHEGHE